MHVKDRLAELKSVTGDKAKPGQVLIEVYSENNEKVHEVLKKFEKIRIWIEDINERTRNMKKLSSEPTFQTSKHMQEEMESSMTQCSALCIKICGAIREFQDKINEEENDIISRIINLQFYTTNKIYADALTDHENFLNKYRESRMALLKQQIKLTNQSITEEECQRLLESNKMSTFVDNIEMETREAKLNLQNMETRHKELIRIENALKEVREMFVQMATLVNKQQDLFNTVEYFATQATNNVDQGNQQLQNGYKNKTSANKKKISVIVCVLTGALIVLLVLIFT